MSSVTEIMLALSSMDPSVRNPAEAAVNQAKEADLANFLIALITELRDDSKPSSSRQMAGIVLKNSVALHLREVAAREALERKWTTLPADVRARVKAEVLATLGSENKEVRHIAALIIGNLSRIELPANEWPQLIETLVGATNSGNEQHTEAALTAIGYICEEAHEYEAMEEYLAQFSSPILAAVGHGMSSSSDEVKYYATNALCNSMEFIHNNMNQQDQRDYLVQIACSAARGNQSDRVREKAMECLVKIADLYYDTLPAYISQLHEITTSAVFNDKESVALQAMLFWTSICETERDLAADEPQKNLNYARVGASQLADLCMKCLLRQEEGQTEDDWNLSIAGGKLLQALSNCLGDDILQYVMPFVYANINSSAWRECEAALMAFGCILGGPDPKSIQDTVAQAIPGLLQYVRHTHELVSDTAGWVLGTVCELFPDVFLDVPSNLQQLMNIVGPMITNRTEMAVRACNVVHNLALAYEEEEDQTSNELSSFYSDLVQALLAAIDDPNGHEKLRVTAQETLNVLVDAAAADSFPVLNALVPELQRRLAAQLQQRSQSANTAEVDHLIGLMCGALGGVCEKLGINMRAFVPSIIQLLEAIFKLGSVQDDALIVVGALAHAVKQEFVPYMPALMPYVVAGLQQVDQEELCHVAAGTVGDCATSLQESFAPFAEGPLVAIRDCLNHPNVDRDVKCSLLGCLGDVALSLGSAHFQPYLATFAQIVATMYEESKKLNLKGDFDAEEYVLGLWDSICGFYTGLCQGYNGNITPLLPHLQEILTFALEVTHQSRLMDSYDVFAAGLGVIGDLANILVNAEPGIRQSGKTSLLTAQVRQLIAEGHKIRDEKVVEQAEWTGKQLAALERA